jgi:hypothetical protein
MSIADETNAAVENRRSDRVSLAVPVDVFGIDLFGKDFHEKAFTERVSRHGASIVIARALAPEQVITLGRQSPKLEAEARIVGQVGICPTGHIYGIALVQEVKFWGIRFAPLAPAENALVRLVLSCCSCSSQEVVDLTEIEFSVLQANDRLARPCPTCRQPTVWTHGNITPSPSDLLTATLLDVAPRQALQPSPGTYPVRRKYSRLAVNLLSCVKKPGEEELVRALDISRGGVRFQSSRKYDDHTWLQISVPFTLGGANIFTPGRIVWSAHLSNNEAAQYGVKYISPSY